MDWGHTFFAAEEGLLGLLALSVAIPVFGLTGSPGRKLVASSPNLMAIAAFVLSCLLAGAPGIEDSPWVDYFPLGGLLATVALLVPSIRALRHRWLAVLHLLTLAAALYLWFIGSLAISYDAT